MNAFDRYDYELVVVWKTGETQVYPAKNREDAYRQQANMLRAFGNQVAYCEPRRIYK